MRIAAFPKAYLGPMIVQRTMTVFDWIERARTLPVDGLELHTGFFWAGDRAERERVAEALEAAGFEMPMMCASPDLVNPDPDIRARELDAQVEAIELTAALGGPGASCRVLTGQADPEVSVEQGLDWAADGILQLIPVAREHGVVLALENHYKASTWRYPEFAQAKDTYLSLLDRISERRWFGVQYDPSNAIMAGEDSADFLLDVIDRVVTMQASDRSLAPGVTLDDLRAGDGNVGYAAGLQHGVVGEGLNDYPRIFRTLTEHGYDGWISIEDGVNGMDEMRTSAEFLQEARERWFGGSHDVRVRVLEAADHNEEENSR